MKPISKINKNLLSLSLLLIFATATSNAQITIRETSVIEKAALKPQRFDSLSNIAQQTSPMDYRKFIGYKLFFLPKSKYHKLENASNDNRVIDYLFSSDTIKAEKKSKGFGRGLLKLGLDATGVGKGIITDDEKERKGPKVYLPYESKSAEIGTVPDSVEGKYFTIIDIKGRKYFDDDLNYQKLEDITETNYMLIHYKITLKNESNQDTLIWIAKYGNWHKNQFFLVAYFEKQRNMYLNKNLVLKPKVDQLTDLVDVNTGSLVDIKPGEVWTCTDISFIDSKDFFYMKPYCFLKNGEREVKVPLDVYNSNSNNRKLFIRQYFMLETEFKKQELEKLKKEEEIKREEQEREKQAQLEIINFRKNCITKWGQKMGTYVADGKVVVGMNKEMCTAAWGEPIDVNKTIARGFTTEQWVYGLGTYLYFEKGVLTTIQN